MERPIPYKGDQPYIFISYAHKDSSLVWPIVDRMQKDGCRVWYDEGIDPGTEWDENIASHVRDCGFFVAFISGRYLASDNCKDELNFARDQDKPIVLVYLEDIQLPRGMALRLGRSPSLRHDRAGKFYGNLYAAEGIGAFGAPTPRSGGKKSPFKGLVSVMLIGLALLAALAFALSDGERTPPEGSAASITSSQPTSQQEEERGVQSAVLVNDGYMKVTALGIDESDPEALILNVSVQNKSDKDFLIFPSESFFNGCKCWEDDTGTPNVPAGETVELQFRYLWEDLNALGVEEVTVIEGIFHGNYIDGSTWFVYYPYGEDFARWVEYESDDNDIALVDTEEYSVYMDECWYDEENDWVMSVYCVNRTDQTLSFTVSADLNGYTNYVSEGFIAGPGNTVCGWIRWDDWEWMGQDKVRLVEGSVFVQDTLYYDIYGQTHFTFYPEGDAAVDTAFVPGGDDICLVDNEYLRAYIIGTMRENHPYESNGELRDWWTESVIICYENVSDQEYYGTLWGLSMNGEVKGDYGMMTLEPGERWVNEYTCSQTDDGVITISADLELKNSKEEVFFRQAFSAKVPVEE